MRWGQMPYYQAPAQTPKVQGPNGWVDAPPPQPIDPTFESYKLGAGRNLDLATGEGTYQQGVLDQTYGYGTTGAANPYSRAALLEESFKRSQRGTTNRLAGQGQLYSGAYGRQQGENSRQYSIASDANRRAYDQASHGIAYGQGQAAATYGTGLSNEAYNAVLRPLGLGG